MSHSKILKKFFLEFEIDLGYYEINNKKTLNQTEFKLIDDYVYVLCLDLLYIIDCIGGGGESDVGGLSISKEGKEWIKLFTIKYWMINFDLDEITRYPIPQNLNNNKELISAIILLNSGDNWKLLSKISMEGINNIYFHLYHFSKFSTFNFLKK